MGSSEPASGAFLVIGPPSSIPGTALSVLTAVGRVHVSRPYYLCGHCHRGQFPADAELDIVQTECSPGVRRMQAVVGQQAPFDHGRRQLELRWSAADRQGGRTAEGSETISRRGSKARSSGLDGAAAGGGGTRPHPKTRIPVVSGTRTYTRAKRSHRCGLLRPAQTPMWRPGRNGRQRSFPAIQSRPLSRPPALVGLGTPASPPRQVALDHASGRPSGKSRR